MVPQRSVLQGAKGKFVYVVDEDGKARATPVEVGSFYGDRWIITSGLAGGEQVVVEGVVKVQPGALLRITAPASAPNPPVQP
jgi:membrane fusion protein (multidrug efflux system)